ncbi:hypothetical protein LTR66_001351 [Elasticomyces elasticus]|nr:hypothetical protein LTR66_001351 [Elasticomyces elasticus]KAK5007904.1 hypothetical protein LTR28_004683 [Elasticomyces elasticus]
MAQKCVHKGCGKIFGDENDECVYHPGPPVFHEGQKGWKCCKPRVLTFDEFMTIPPCTTGKHSTVDDTPAPEPKPVEEEQVDAPNPVERAAETALPPPAARVPQAQISRPSPAPAPPEEEFDDPDATVPTGAACRRRGCGASYASGSDRTSENCVHHPGQALFHEGSKGWTCCKRRVLEFDQFLKIEGCKTKKRHLFVGSKNESGEEELETVRSDFYQTPGTVIASLYLKKINKDTSTVAFASASTVDLDLHTSDKKHYKNAMPLFAPVDPEKSSFKIMGTKLELTLAKADGTSWPVLRADDRHTGEIIQIGSAGRA